MRPATLLLVAVFLIAGALGWLLLVSDDDATHSSGAAAPEPVAELPMTKPEPVIPRTPVANTRRDVEAQPRATPDQLSDLRGDPTDATRLRVSGSVSDRSGAPLRGIRIAIGPSLPNSSIALDAPDYPSGSFEQILRTTSDHGGQFEFLIDLDVPLWTLAIRAQGYGNFDRFELDLPTSGYFGLGQVVLDQAIEISGRVLDQQDLAIPGAKLYLTRDRGPLMEEPRFVRSSLLETTDATGAFHITSMPAGLVRLYVESATHTDRLYNAGSASSGKHLTNTVIRLSDLPVTCTLTGIVTASDEPLSGAVVRLYADATQALDAENELDPAESVPTAISNDHGGYTLTGIELGTRTISVERPNFGMRQLWTIELLESAARCNLVLDEHRLTGFVSTPDGVPLAGVQLRVERVRQNATKTGYRTVEGSSIPLPEQAAINRVVYSEPDGSFAIDGLDASTGLVLIAESRWRITTQSKVFAFELGLDQIELNLSLPIAGRVQAQLSFGSDRRAGYRLAASPSDREGQRSLSSPVDPNGLIELGSLAPGAYQFQLLSPDEPAQVIRTVEGQIESNQVLELQFVLL